MEKNKSNLMAKFLVPSIVGIVLFMIPVKFDGSWTIAVKILADMIGNAIAGTVRGNRHRFRNHVSSFTG